MPRPAAASSPSTGWRGGDRQDAAAGTDVARHHIRRNGAARWVRVDGTVGPGRHTGYDLVFANILARPLMSMARDLARIVAPGGTAILSGLLRRQEAGVLAAYRAQRLHLDFRVVGDGWSSLVLRK